MGRPLILAGLIAAVVAFAALVPLQIPHTISVPGKVYPAQEWTLLRDASGALGSVLRDHARGTVESFSASQFVRGDAVRVNFAPALHPTSIVSAGDTIASIYSNETERQLSELTGNLAAVMSMLDVYSTGEKPEIVQQAEAQVRRARELVRQQEATVERLRILRARDHASLEELQLAETQLSVYESDLQIALAGLAAAQTGAKPEQLNLTRTEAEALQREIETLQNRLNLFTITSPITGMAVRSFGPDTLLTVKSNVSYVVVMPVPWRRFAIIEPGQRVTMKSPRGDGTFESVITQFGDGVHMVNGAPVVMASAFVTDQDSRLIPGAIVSCSIETGKVSLFEYLRRVIS